MSRGTAGTGRNRRVIRRRRINRGAIRAAGLDPEGTATIHALALWALTQRKGLTPTEESTAEALTLGPGWWRKARETTAAGKALKLEGAVVDATAWWMQGGTIGRCRHQTLRRLLREQAFANHRASTLLLWPKAARRQARALEEVERVEGAGSTPPTREALSRLRIAWSIRAYETASISDANDLETLIAKDEDALDEMLMQADNGYDIDDAYAIVHMLKENPVGLPQLRACEYAATRALACARHTEGKERLGALWLRATALEQMGHTQRALRAYAVCEAEEERVLEAKHLFARSGNDLDTETPGGPEARRRHTRLLWTSGEPEAMTQAIEQCRRTGDWVFGAWGNTKKRQIADEAWHIVRDIREAIKRHDQTIVRESAQRETRERARAELATAYRKAGLEKRATSLALEEASNADAEYTLALIAVDTLDILGTHEARIATAATRAIRAKPQAPKGYVALANTHLALKRHASAQEAALRALHLDTRADPSHALNLDERNTLAKILTECGRADTAQAIDRSLGEDARLRRAPMVTAERCERAVLNGIHPATTLLDALDAAACTRVGIASIAVVVAHAMRTQAAKLSHSPDTAGAERLRTAVGTVRMNTSRATLDSKRDDLKAARKHIASEPRAVTRVCARTPEPLSHALRALHIAMLRRMKHPADESERALEAGAWRRVATLLVEWALRAPAAGTPGEPTVRQMLMQMRDRTASTASAEWGGCVEAPGTSTSPTPDTRATKKGENANAPDPPRHRHANGTAKEEAGRGATRKPTTMPRSEATERIRTYADSYRSGE